MNKKTDKGIILTRTDFAERDRILTVLLREGGKVRLIAKGVRSAKSKLAGGIELFSESDLGYIQGRGEVFTLTSSRLIRHFDHIVQDYEKTQEAYEMIRLINRIVDDGHGQEYYPLLLGALGYLDKQSLSKIAVSIWFYMNLLELMGSSINLKTDRADKSLQEANNYSFDYDKNCFYPDESGVFSKQTIKLLRVVNGSNKPVPTDIPMEEQERSGRLLCQAAQEAIR